MSLAHYNLKKDIIVASDASNLGLGAVILYKESNSHVKAIMHALRIFLPALKGYSKIEKEALRIIFAVKNSIEEKVHEKGFMLQTTHYYYFWFQKRDSNTCCKSTAEMRKL